MADEVIPVSAEWAKRAYVDDAKYKAMYDASVKDPAASGTSTASGSTGSSPTAPPPCATSITTATSASAGFTMAC